MREIYLSFRSVTSAMEALRLLTGNGIRANLRRTPEAMRSRGCGYSLGIPERKGQDAVSFLRQKGASFERAFRKDESGIWQEVVL